VVCVIQATMAYHEIPIKHCLVGSLPFIISGGIMYRAILHLHFVHLPTVLDISLQVLSGALCYLGIVGLLCLLFQKKYAIHYLSK